MRQPGHPAPGCGACAAREYVHLAALGLLNTHSFRRGRAGQQIAAQHKGQWHLATHPQSTLSLTHIAPHLKSTVSPSHWPVLRVHCAGQQQGLQVRHALITGSPGVTHSSEPRRKVRTFQYIEPLGFAGWAPCHGSGFRRLAGR